MVRSFRADAENEKWLMEQVAQGKEATYLINAALRLYRSINADLDLQELDIKEQRLHRELLAIAKCRIDVRARIQTEAQEQMITKEKELSLHAIETLNEELRQSPNRLQVILSAKMKNKLYESNCFFKKHVDEQMKIWGGK
jgi:hypothetical protein